MASETKEVIRGAKKAVKHLAIFIISILIIVNVFLWWLGGSTIVITAIFYALIWVAATGLIRVVFSNPEKRLNFKIAITMLVLALFAVELVLKYLVGNYNYNFDMPAFEALGKKYIKRQADLRLKHYPPNWTETKIDINSDEYHYSHSYNSLGLRGTEPSIDTALTNVVALGDSYTKGFGAPEDSTCVVLLEGKLNQGKGAVKKIQCINGGVSGSDPFAEFIVLEDLLLKFNPKIVIVAVNATDIDDVVHSGGWERYSASNEIVLKSRPWWFPLYQCSFIARYIIHGPLHLNSRLLTDEQEKAESKIAIAKLQHCIADDYLKLARKHHFKLVVVMSPMLRELDNSRFELQPLFDSLNNRPELVVVNLYEGFGHRMKDAGLQNKSLYWPIDGHNNAAGYNLWAELLKGPTASALASDIPNTK